MRVATASKLIAGVFAIVVLAACGGAPAGEDGAGASDATSEPTADPTSEPTSEPTAEPTSEPTSEPEAEDGIASPVLHLVATVAPVTDLVARVGGERVEVVSLVPPGADSHTYEPRPQDVAVLADADAYFGVGLDLNDGAIDLARQHLSDDAPVVLLGERALDEDRLVFDHSHGDDGHSHGDDGHSHGDDGHSHGDDGHSHGEDGHSHGDDRDLGPNPHVWTSIRNAIDLVGGIADELAALDPDGAESYRSNASALVAELDALDDAVAVATATVPAGDRTLVTYHDAWTYFARDHGFEFVTAVQPGDFSEPSAADVREVIDLIHELEVPAVFGSEVFPSRVLDAIAAETDAVYVGDLSDDSLPGDPDDPEHSYLELMRRNAIVIVDALGGDSSVLAR